MLCAIFTSNGRQKKPDERSNNNLVLGPFADGVCLL